MSKPPDHEGREFGSQISDNMDRWKSRGWKSQRRESEKKEDQRKESKKRRSRARKGSCFSSVLWPRRVFLLRGTRKGFCTLPQSEQNVRVFVAISKTLAGVGSLKKTCEDACRVAGAVQETSSSKKLGGQGADFLRGVAFWSIRSSGLPR